MSSDVFRVLLLTSWPRSETHHRGNPLFTVTPVSSGFETSVFEMHLKIECRNHIGHVNRHLPVPLTPLTHTRPSMVPRSTTCVHNVLHNFLPHAAWACDCGDEQYVARAAFGFSAVIISSSISHLLFKTFFSFTSSNPQAGTVRCG